MSMTDPIADMLTRIRNAIRIRRDKVLMPSSKVKLGIAKVLKEEGYIQDFAVEPSKPRDNLVIQLKYGPEGELVIKRIQRESTPGRRMYSGVEDLKPVLQGLGIVILSTSRGIMSDRRVRAERVGGEVLCTIW